MRTPPVPLVQAVQACVPRHRSLSREVVRLQAVSLCDPVDHLAGTEALRNDLHLDLVRPVPVNLRRDIYLNDGRPTKRRLVALEQNEGYQAFISFPKTEL
jgi:hypothetical protein